MLKISTDADFQHFILKMYAVGMVIGTVLRCKLQRLWSFFYIVMGRPDFL